nr:ABSCISIC ACID-INSENSITIVE 5-like protein 2 [Ipomoea batatas]GMD48045.1 ABSCISIC ACID-INSENSITIVE 5-like protein 2 [Ipomoea batatas]
MGSEGGCGGTRMQDPKSNGLEREGSLYSLTLDEVQQQFGGLGKPLSSMNLDELLKTVCTAEAASQGVQQRVDYSGAPLASGASLNRQSSLELSGDLSKKTVDEVWQDIQQGQKSSSLERKATLGEMTLEDFLVQARIVAESSQGKNDLGSVQGDDSTVNVAQQAHSALFHVPPIQQPRPPQSHQQQVSAMPGFMAAHPVQQAIPVGPNPIMDATFPGTQMTAALDPMMGTLSDTQTLGRKRVAPDNVVIEKSVERRQKRMIKNRESAARSRARKQAYTNELENKISRLEEENARLRREKEIEKAMPTVPPPEPKYQLRRTSSAPF